MVLVSVALQTLRAVESRALMVTYDQYSQPDFFYEPATAADAATGGTRHFLHRIGSKRPAPVKALCCVSVSAITAVKLRILRESKLPFQENEHL